MEIRIQTTKVKPSKTHQPLLDSVGVENILVEDVASFVFTDDGIQIAFNNSPDEFIPLRGLDGVDNIDWRSATLVVTRKFLRVDMSH